MTREEILEDQWVIDHYVDFYHPDYLNPDFEAGVDYGEKKTIEKACEWLLCQEEMIGISFEDDFIERFKKAMEE